jgi:hypothetical protein
MTTETKRHLIKFFINKFTRIPSKRWVIPAFSDRHGAHCALGHLGVTEEMSEKVQVQEYPPLAFQMIELFDGDEGSITSINDNTDDEYSQRGPRARILAALHDKLKECL